MVEKLFLKSYLYMSKESFSIPIGTSLIFIGSLTTKSKVICLGKTGIFFAINLVDSFKFKHVCFI
jgi:hypothetical protein